MVSSNLLHEYTINVYYRWGDIVTDTQKIINNAIESMDGMTILFYQQKTEEGFQKLDSTLTTIAEAINYIYKANEDIAQNYMEIPNILNKAMAALEKKDTILLSDILTYELKGIFEKALELL